MAMANFEAPCKPLTGAQSGCGRGQKGSRPADHVDLKLAKMREQKKQQEGEAERRRAGQLELTTDSLRHPLRGRPETSVRQRHLEDPSQHRVPASPGGPASLPF